jgi:hypothetical protein
MALPGVNGNSTSTVNVKHPEQVLKNKSKRWTGMFGEGGYLWGDIDPPKAVWPLTTWCFLTGYMSVVRLLRREGYP